MKTQVIIEEGFVRIKLSPENEFEKTILKDTRSGNYEIKGHVHKSGSYYDEQYDLIVNLVTPISTTEKTDRLIQTLGK